jgi:transcription factor C subunit 6
MSPRKLRPRKSQPNYAALAGYEDEAGPSKQIIESENSESDFAPEGKAEAEEEDDDEEMSEEDAEGEDLEDNFEEEVVVKPRKRASTAKAVSKGKAKATPTPKAMLAPGAGLPRTSRRQMYMLPTPSIHHRHRATPLFARPGLVERVTARPSLFDTTQTALTNAFTHSARITDRVNKSWGYNVGPGPLWQIAEDRRWFKEAAENAGTEAERRPRVYAGVRVKSGWKLLDKKYQPHLLDVVRR